jgi:hypothetical protein
MRGTYEVIEEKDAKIREMAARISDMEDVLMEAAILLRHLKRHQHIVKRIDEVIDIKTMRKRLK